MIIHIGTMTLGCLVDITDPCYDKNVWFRITSDCEEGTYEGYVDVVDIPGFGKRVKSISIYKDNKITPTDEWIGDIGVDSGLAGFFNNKQDFSDEKWEEFCDSLGSDLYWQGYGGLFSSAGFGDGDYSVYANEYLTAFSIVFMEG